MAQEDEVYGNGLTYCATFWEYDSRLGRRWNLDPAYKHFLSNYSTFGNNPIIFLDPNGDDWFVNHQGFYIWSNESFVQGFEYSGTNLPEGVSRYRILKIVNGKLYHANTISVFSRVGNYFGGSFVDHKPYNPAEESFNDEMFYTAVGIGVFRAGGWGWRLMKGLGGSLWNEANPLIRGFIYEAMAGGNLCRNYPVIDKFVQGIATSIKTLDLKAKTYQEAGAVFSKLKGFIDKLANFTGANKGGVNTQGRITGRILDVGIPKGATQQQISEIQEAVQYGLQNNVLVKANVVK